jgi:hypothetical protein
MNKKIPFPSITNNGIRLQKYHIAIALKTRFEEILAKKAGPTVFYIDSRPSVLRTDRGVLAIY